MKAKEITTDLLEELSLQAQKAMADAMDKAIYEQPIISERKVTLREKIKAHFAVWCERLATAWEVLRGEHYCCDDY